MGIKSVEMVRKIRDCNYENTRDMTTEEYLAYIQAKAATLHNKAKSVGKSSSKARFLRNPGQKTV